MPVKRVLLPNLTPRNPPNLRSEPPGNPQTKISGNLRKSPEISGNPVYLLKSDRPKSPEISGRKGVSWGFGCQVWEFPGGLVLGVSFVALGAQGCLLCFQWVHYVVSQVHGFIGY